ncbi:STAS domain-containing protein [Streptomyces sp. NBC_00690]|uniref:STAS domain-containing protein n=1 Tax=Streptomyces sp. NBC_00690 TaxID=2975808 RepID=UPI002E2E0F3E|nr:STAS domain-containing protein [Streptomyces sp. NBC_00690]
MSWNEAALSTCTSSTSGTLTLEEITVHASHPPVVRQYEYRGAWVIAAAGDYDLDSIAPLRQALHTAARRYPKVVLDASAVTFADSTFLNLLILTHQMGTLRVVAPSAQVRRLCEITGVDRFLEMRQTIEEAAAS